MWDFYDDSINEEVNVAQLRAGIASSIGCPQDSVEVVSEVGEDNILRVNYVTVFLDIELAKKIGKYEKNI